jgi:hypothetical protein
VAQWQEVGSIDIQGPPWRRLWLRWREAKARQWRQRRFWRHRPRRRQVRRGPRQGGASPPPPPLPPHAIDSSGRAMRRGVLLPGGARGQSAATKGSSNHPKVPSQHILDLIFPRVSALQLPPLSLTLSLWTRSYLPLPPFCLALFFAFFNPAFPRPRNGAGAYSCAAAD